MGKLECLTPETQTFDSDFSLVYKDHTETIFQMDIISEIFLLHVTDNTMRAITIFIPAILWAKVIGLG